MNIYFFNGVMEEELICGAARVGYRLELGNELLVGGKTQLEVARARKHHGVRGAHLVEHYASNSHNSIPSSGITQMIEYKNTINLSSRTDIFVCRLRIRLV